MYLVVLYWEPIPGHEDQFEQIGTAMRDVLRKQPGVEFIEGFNSSGKRVAVHAYKDEATYDAIVSDPGGPFNRALAEYHLEAHAKWLGSEKGTTLSGS